MMLEINNRWIHDIWIVKACLMTQSVLELGLKEGWNQEPKSKERHWGRLCAKSTVDRLGRNYCS